MIEPRTPNDRPVRTVASLRRRFARETGGNVALMTGLSAFALVSAVGVALDGTRVLQARAEFQKAVDGAALAIGTTYLPQENLQAMGERFVAENFSMADATVTSIVVESDAEVVSIAGTMTMDLYLAKIFTDAQPEISVGTEVQRAGGGLMVSLVLDNTGSMWGKLNGKSRIETLRSASLRLSNVLFDGQLEDDNLRVSIVPYTSVVNPGAEAKKIVDYDGVRAHGTQGERPPLLDDDLGPGDQEQQTRKTLNEVWDGTFTQWNFNESQNSAAVNDTEYDFRTPTYLPHFRVPVEDADDVTFGDVDDKPFGRRLWLHYDPSDKRQWKGCVFERPGANAVSDAPPSAERWKPFIYPIAPDNQYELTHEEWPGYWDIQDFHEFHSELYLPKEDTILEGGGYNANKFHGPNTTCPTPILPLTKTKSDIDDAINAMTAWNRGGTLGSIGMAWGYRTLTPGLPFTQSATEIDPLTTETIWDSTRWRRAIVLMTDGDNVVYDTPDRPNDEDRVRDGDEGSDMTGFGRLGTARFEATIDASTKGAAKTKVDQQLAALCADIKRDNVIIYSIVFSNSANSATRTLYEGCATDPGKFFFAPTANALDNAFGTIGADLNKLRIKR